MNILQTIDRAKERYRAGRLAEAEGLLRELIAAEPGCAEAYVGLGYALRDQGRLEEAKTCAIRAIELSPSTAARYLDLALIFKVAGRLDLAAESCRRAIELAPADVAGYMELGNALWLQGNYSDAANAFSRATQIAPADAGAHSNLGVALWKAGRLDDALVACQKAVALQPDGAESHCNLGNVLREQGRIVEAVQCYDRAMALRPGDASMHSNRNCLLQYLAGDQGELIFQQHQLWNRLHAPPSAPRPTPRRPAPMRLRIGYVSSDFRDHAVAGFFLPALESRDRHSFEVVCYSDVACSDGMTKRLAASADAWRQIAGISDDRVAEMIAKDGIDILVDLAGHTANNRLTLFARRAAPVQVTWLGYPGTTGLTAMDYRITDALADPPGMTERFHSERLIRLPACAWCFQPPADSPSPGPLPAEQNGYMTFACFNTLAKLSDRTLALWAECLRQPETANARLLLKAKGLNSPGSRRRIVDVLARHGINKDRLIFMDWTATTREHLEAYRHIDIALDPFPYHGTTTTCQALWMGVPVLTLAGPTHVSRVGVSLLTNAGLPGWVANSGADFVRLAMQWSIDRHGLGNLRRQLRQQVAASALMDAARFSRDLEASYRAIAAAAE